MLNSSNFEHLLIARFEHLLIARSFQCWQRGIPGVRYGALSFSILKAETIPAAPPPPPAHDGPPEIVRLDLGGSNCLGVGPLAARSSGAP